MSLADEFLDDLDYEEAEPLISTQQEPSLEAQFATPSLASKKRKFDGLDKDGAGGDDPNNEDLDSDGNGNDDNGDDFDADMEETETDRALAAMMRDVQDAKNARDIAKLMDSPEMQGILKVKQQRCASSTLTPSIDLDSRCNIY